MNHGPAQSLVAKRVGIGVRRRRVSHIRRSCEHRAFGAPMNRNCTLWTLRVVLLKAFSLLRFFVALDKEMTCRHAQWLTVIKKIAHSSRPLRSKAATRHRPRPLTQEPGNPALTLPANAETWQPGIKPDRQRWNRASTPTANPNPPHAQNPKCERPSRGLLTSWPD